jgi:hypothetical protein
MNTNPESFYCRQSASCVAGLAAFAKPLQHARHQALSNVPADAQASTTTRRQNSHA